MNFKWRNRELSRKGGKKIWGGKGKPLESMILQKGGVLTSWKEILKFKVVNPGKIMNKSISKGMNSLQ